ncbi:MAG: response regulator [Bacillota bacterium]|nr:MAG: response regulator [Bacillota bacterium]
MVIDPAAYARRTVREALAPLPYWVEELTGEEPEDLLRQAAGRADVLIVDPVRRGSHAEAWLRRLASANPRAVLVVCTALTTRTDVIAYRRAGAVEVVAKPFRPRRLQRAVGAGTGSGCG